MATQSASIPSTAPSLGLAALLIRLRALVALFIVLVFFSTLAPNFLSIGSLLIMAKHIAIIAMLGIGMTYVILTGGIDLSVGSIAGLSGMVAGALILHGLTIVPLGLVIYPSVPMVVLIAVLLGGLIGLANGTLVTRLGVAPFIATLGMLYVARGAALLLSDGATFPNLVGSPDYGNQGFPWLGAGRMLGVPVPVLIVLMLALAAAFVAARTPFGRYVYAVGGNARAALLSGVRVGGVTRAVYVISGMCAGLVGLLVASDLVSAHPASGQTFELSAIAAVVLGGASLAGGRGTIGGTMVGACVIGTLGDGMVMMGVSEFWQMVIKGTVIVAAVVFDQLQARFGGRES
ncbi:erythritol ABC transporter membrane protein [Sphingomonas gellani]|uniref:Erythritol ABC transporter membrane protein n=1 Tax=Sphingomonas gellani TaxID=1166340 RepID=A0A1H8JUI0_9SPHN|nr:ABC transporter permease [Sphingomonas gellani]SEN84155.1 erythritol ABC transporter membrane protein [Sphingomonas gellani]